MPKQFTEAEWTKILSLAEKSAERYGLPARRRKSLLIGSFNIRKLGRLENKSDGSWQLLAFICKRYDLLAVQEVLDNLDGLRHLCSLMGDRYRLIVSDTTGNYPGDGTSPERLAFIYNKWRVRRGEVASDITNDRTNVINTINKNRDAFWEAFSDLDERLTAWEVKAAEKRAEGKRAPGKPAVHLPQFVTFIRQPHCVAFEVGSRRSQNPYQFLTVNVHLLYGRYKDERFMEFLAIISWLVERAKKKEALYFPNILLLGDCNLYYRKPSNQRPIIDAFLKALNRNEGLEADPRNAILNFPFLDVHPDQTDVFRTAARQEDTYDQIALLFRDKRLPDYKQNAVAGRQDKDGYDYGVFNFVELIAIALQNKSFNELDDDERDELIDHFQHDVTDHLPIWIRLPMPK